MKDYSWIQASGLRREFQSLDRDARNESEYLSQHKEFMYSNCKPHDIDPIFWEFMYKGYVIKHSFHNAKEVAVHLTNLLNISAHINKDEIHGNVYFSIRVPGLSSLYKDYLMNIITARIMIDGNYPTAYDIQNLSERSQRYVREKKIDNINYGKGEYLVQNLSRGETYKKVKEKFKDTLPERYFDLPEQS